MNRTAGTPVVLETGYCILRSPRPGNITQCYVEWWMDPTVMEAIALSSSNATVDHQRQKLFKM